MDSEDPFAIFQNPIKRPPPDNLEDEGARKILHQDSLVQPEGFLLP